MEFFIHIKLRVNSNYRYKYKYNKFKTAEWAKDCNLEHKTNNEMQ